MITPCGSSVTIKMVGPDGAKFKIERVPSHGSLSQVDENTMLWVPDPSFCNTSIGGNDGFVYSWVDPQGNTGVITRLFVLEQKGDVPRIIKTGVVKVDQTLAKNAKADLASNSSNVTKAVISKKWLSSPEVSFASKLASSTITCTKGKISTKVTGINPSCPTGYKKK